MFKYVVHSWKEILFFNYWYLSLIFCSKNNSFSRNVHQMFTTTIFRWITRRKKKYIPISFISVHHNLFFLFFSQFALKNKDIKWSKVYPTTINYLFFYPISNPGFLLLLNDEHKTVQTTINTSPSDNIPALTLSWAVMGIEC